MEAIKYYLPAFLLSASLDLYGTTGDRIYSTDIADGLLLAIPDTPEMRKRTDDELCPFGLVSFCPFGRVALYSVLTPNQRKCVAFYLRLYWKDYWVASGAVTEDRQLIFNSIIDCWENSSLVMDDIQTSTSPTFVDVF